MKAPFCSPILLKIHAKLPLLLLEWPVLQWALLLWFGERVDKIIVFSMVS